MTAQHRLDKNYNSHEDLLGSQEKCVTFVVKCIHDRVEYFARHLWTVRLLETSIRIEIDMSQWL